MRDCELRKEIIKEALSVGNYAECPFGTNKKFIWDWQQDNLIEITENLNVEDISIPLSRFNDFHEDIREYVCNDEDDSEIGEKIILHKLDDFIYGFATENGTEFFPKEWRDIDWEKCGYRQR